MRDILSKVMTGSMIAGAALLVAACGGGSEANNTAEDNGLGTDVYNTEMPADLNGTDMNGMDNSLSGDLNQAANAIENAGEAIDNAQENTGQ